MPLDFFFFTVLYVIKVLESSDFTNNFFSTHFPLLSLLSYIMPDFKHCASTLDDFYS